MTAKPDDPTATVPLDPQVHLAYEKRRRYRRLAILFFVITWLVAMLSGVWSGTGLPAWFAGLLLLCMAGCVIIGVFAWRCPRCGYYISGGHAFSSQSRFCWKCGVRLS
jgi:hypothetical protein